jgi:hypothetical protein
MRRKVLLWSIFAFGFIAGFVGVHTYAAMQEAIKSACESV